ncbi:NADP-dependent oxidoreductase [Actinocrispum sp. NPDC049592]|uniref:NADP-dependent oxidoreductase n=1 Tax=Actinocrispum sp. NPDC049592 TaxID=3154835 RepID=UPI003443FBF0
MRAVIINSFGGPEVVEVADVPVPRTGPGQVRIRVAAAGVNPVDLGTRAGALAAGGLMAGEGRVGLGWDVAGVVEESRADGFASGDRVAGLCDRLDLPTKAQADYVVLDSAAVAKTDLDPVAAASLPLNVTTAAQALDLLALTAGQTLLVTGAAGALGGFAVELAAARGLRVVAVAGQDDETVVRGFGADWFVPRTVPLAESVRAVVPGGVDGALDAAVLGIPALAAVRGGGAFVAVRGGVQPLPLRGTRVQTVWARADGAQLAGLLPKVTPRVADTLPLTEVAEAHRRLAKGGLRGRLVLVP